MQITAKRQRQGGWKKGEISKKRKGQGWGPKGGSKQNYKRWFERKKSWLKGIWGWGIRSEKGKAETLKNQTPETAKTLPPKVEGTEALGGLGSHLDEKNRSGIGRNGLRQRLENPDRSFRKTQKNCRKTAENFGRSQALTCFQCRSQKMGRKVRPGGPGRRLWAKKCDPPFRLSRWQIFKKVVVSVAAGVAYLWNRARNTRKLEILMF